MLDVCNTGAIIIVESTVSPGTMNRHVVPIIENKGFILGKDIYLVHAPERILPGNMVYELKHNSRTIGAEEQFVGEKVKKIYEWICNCFTI